MFNIFSCFFPKSRPESPPTKPKSLPKSLPKAKSLELINIYEFLKDGHKDPTPSPNIEFKSKKIDQNAFTNEQLEIYLKEKMQEK